MVLDVMFLDSQLFQDLYPHCFRIKTPDLTMAFSQADIFNTIFKMTTQKDRLLIEDELNV
jgi:hypothetical protein